MKWSFFYILGGILVLSIGSVPAPPANQPRQVIVQFKAGEDEAGVKEKVEKHGGRVKKHIRKQGKGSLAVVETAELVEQAVEKFKKDPDVEFAEPDWIVRHQGIAEQTLIFKQEATELTEKNKNSVLDVISPQALANDPYYSAGYLWGLMDAGANAFGTRASVAWAAGFTGAKSVYVGVIDEGVEWQHADLAANMWNNPFDPVDGLDNDGNGYADDAQGWDFYSGDNSVYDAGGDAHGTHVASTIAAAGGNGRGVVGVNWNATVISTKFLGAEGGYVSDAIAAIDYYVDLKQRHGLNIVALNNSWGGGGYSQALHDAILRAAKAGILFVAAAGNGDANGVALNNDTLANYPSNYDTTRGTSTESAAGYNAMIAVAANRSLWRAWHLLQLWFPHGSYRRARGGRAFHCARRVFVFGRNLDGDTARHGRDCVICFDACEQIGQRDSASDPAERSADGRASRKNDHRRSTESRAGDRADYGRVGGQV